MKSVISPEAVRRLLLTRQEVALIDLREEGPFASGHPLFASQLSAGRIEVEILDKVPRKATTIVLYDDGEGLVDGAAALLGSLGYTHVYALDGGLTGWKNAGYELFQDVNSYSKAFGELVEHRRHTPSLSASEVKGLIDAKADICVMDARRFEEYSTMSIPTATSVPGAELVLRAGSLATDPATTIIVNCAGRTRSIIGTQSLINAALPNRIFALRNGTIGWSLAGQSLDKGKARRFPDPAPVAVAEAKTRARAVAYRAGVRHLTAAELAMIEAPDRTLYRFDVRTPEEYRSAHIPGFRNVPGGQLVQETDMWAPVRGARIVLADDIGPRAEMTASWLAQMGWDAYVLDGGFDGDLETGDFLPTLPPLPQVPTIEPATLASADDVMIIDVATSRQHRAGHIPGARFALAAEIDEVVGNLGQDKSIVLTSSDGTLGAFVTAKLAGRGLVRNLAGGTAAWTEGGHPLATGIEAPLSEVRDIYRRPYEGTDNAAEAMQAYLDWEYGLVDQLARDATHGSFVI